MAEAQSPKELVRKWYVVRAISGKEKKVKQYIEYEVSRLKLGDYVGQAKPGSAPRAVMLSNTAVASLGMPARSPTLSCSVP